MTRSVVSWVMLVILCVLAAFQVALQLSFWAALAGPETHNAWLFQGIGTALTLIEILLLALASEFDAGGEKDRANAARYCFAFLALVNLAADYAAVASYAGSSESERLAGVRRHEVTEAGIDEAERAITRLRRQLEASDLDQPLAALEAARAPLAERADRYTRSGQAIPIQQLERLARYDAAIAITRELVAKEAERTRLLTALDHEDGGSAGNDFFAPLANIAGVFGLDVASEGARGALAFAVALAVKLILTVGLWMVAPNGRDFSTVRSALRQSLRKREHEGDRQPLDVRDQPTQPAPPEPVPLGADGAGDADSRGPRRTQAKALSPVGMAAMLDAWRTPARQANGEDFSSKQT